jgi:uncharacterized protein
MNIKEYLFNFISQNKSNNPERRNFFYKILAGSSIAALGISQSAQAHKVIVDEKKEERFPGDPPEHFMVYSFNHADYEYHQHVLGSVRAMIAKYDDNIDQVVVCYGKGIHALAKNPKRAVDEKIKTEIKNLAAQGVKFHACNRSLSPHNWGKNDVYPFVKIVDVGAADIMELQEQNYAYMVW